MSSSFADLQKCRLPFLKCIIVLTYMLHVITKPSGILALKVSITQNITGFVGKKDTYLTCSSTLEKDQSLISVTITAKNEADNDTPIAVFKPQKAAKLTPLGDYLLGRVTLTNVTYSFVDAAIRFDKLECVDEKDYTCIYNLFGKYDTVHKEKSGPTPILITASSAKPDSILSSKVSSSKAEYQGTTSFNSLNDLYNISLSIHQNTILTHRPFPVDTLTTRQLRPDSNTLITLREGDTVMFTCTGNIGKPPGKFIWQKTSPLQKEAVIYHAETIVKEKMPKICSLKGTSNLSLHISAEDLNATIRCFEESQKGVPGMFIETSPFDVQFPVKHVNTKKQYERQTCSITLTCEGSGNPEPRYIWFKKGNKRNILARTNLYVIENLIRNHSGVYVCEAYNNIDNVHYRMNSSVDIDIVDELSSSEPALSKISAVHAAYVIPLVCACFGIAICLAVRKHRNNKPNRKKNEESRCQKLNDRLMRCLCIKSKYSKTITRNNTDASDGSKDSLAVSNGIQETSFKNENTKKEEMCCHGITVDPEYTYVIIKNDADKSFELEDTLDISSGFEKNESNIRSKKDNQNQDETVDISKNMPMTSDTIYAVPSDALPKEQETSVLSDKHDLKKVGDLQAPYQSSIHATVNEQTVMKHEMCKLHTSDDVDHNGYVSEKKMF